MQVFLLKGHKHCNNSTKLQVSLKLCLITIFKERLCWLVKNTDYWHYFLTEQHIHTWTLLPTAATSNTSAWEYLFVFFLHSLLQNVIDFVSFAIPLLHCRQYCLISLPDYSSREWKENGERTMTMLRSLRNAAEENNFAVIFLWCRSINNLRDCLQVHESFCLYWSSIINALISFLVLARHI